jgi:hypothetical protein
VLVGNRKVAGEDWIVNSNLKEEKTAGGRFKDVADWRDLLWT